MAEIELPENLMGICTQQLLSDVTLPEHSGGDDELEALVSKADLAAIDSIASTSAGAEPRTKRFAAPKIDEEVRQARSSAVS